MTPFCKYRRFRIIPKGPKEFKFQSTDFWKNFRNSAKQDVGDGAAGITYRIGKSRLESEMARIKREEKAEMRMHNTFKQRFVAKYHKRAPIELNPDTPNVKMYETHNPGFCYRRNGECRTPQITPSCPSVDFENIHSLLFTDGQVDIEKVLCLHLLRAHKTETLKPPNTNYRAHHFLTKEQSPLERLIERSKRKHHDTSFTKLLPTYILELKKIKPSDDPSTSNRDDSDIVIKDGRLAARVIINDKIGQLVDTVLSALQTTNPEKLNELLKIANDPQKLTKIMEKENVQKFLNTLTGHFLIFSCESFHLTQPFKTITMTLQMEPGSNNLSKLVSQIRSNVLQLPAHNAWKSLYNEARTSNEEGSSSEVSKEIDLHEKETIKPEAKSIETKNFINKNKIIASKPKSAAQARTRPQSPKPHKREEQNYHLPKFLQYINEAPKRASLKGEDEESTVKSRNEPNESEASGSKFEETVTIEGTLVNIGSLEEQISSNSNTFRNMDIATVATVLSQKAVAAHKRDLESLATSKEESTRSVTSSPPTESEPRKISITQTKCAACLEKWKIPLPTPKIATITKNIIIPTLGQTNFGELKSNSAHKLSLMIDREMQKLKSEKQKEKRKIVIPVRVYDKNKNRICYGSNVDGVHLDVLDLAKINQEIREKETSKKLDQFLNSTL